MSDQSFVTRLTRSSGSNFYYSFLFLPRAQREAIHSVYAFCRAVDDSVDTAEGPDEARRRIGMWREELDACFDGRPTHPITRSLAAHLPRYPIRRRNLEEIIEGVEMDVTPRGFDTFADLREYCYRVASAVGLVCIEIFGYRDPRARQYAVRLGLAFQMTNILRDVRSDAEKGRIYLPREDLDRFACGARELRSARPTPAFIGLMSYETARTRALFEQARASLPEIDKPTLFAAQIMGDIYEAILGKIERRGYDVLRGRITLSRPRKLLIATRRFLTSRAGRPARAA